MRPQTSERGRDRRRLQTDGRNGVETHGIGHDTYYIISPVLSAAARLRPVGPGEEFSEAVLIVWTGLRARACPACSASESEQGLEPTLALLRSAVAYQDFHIAGVGC